MKMLIIILLLFAAIVFVFGLIKAVSYSQEGSDPTKMKPFFRQFVTGIGGALATNLGVVLGISIEQAPDAEIFFKKFVFVDANRPTILQLIAAYLYVFGLLYITYSWWRLYFEEDQTKVVSILPQFSQTLFGVILGIIAVYIGS